MVKSKNKRIAAVICFILAVVMVFAAMPYKYFEVSAIDTSKDNEEALKAKLAQYQSESEEIKKKLQGTQSDINAKEDEKQYLDSLVLATENEITTTKNLLAEYDTKIANITADIDTATVDIENKYQELLGRLSFVYEEENYENYIDMVFNANSLSDAFLTAERIGSMLDFDQSLMSELSAKLELLESEKQALETAKNEQTALMTSLKGKEAELQKQIKDVEKYITTLQADEAAYKAQIEKAAKAEQQTGEEIERLLQAREEQRKAAEEAEKRKKEQEENKKQQQQNGNSSDEPEVIARPSSGGYCWPVPSRSYISVYFGSGGHRGIDIPCSYGASIVAAKAGTVVQSTWHYSWGYYILIDHGDNTATLYAHNSQLLVSAGDYVSGGEVIAKAGNTGNSFGNHCHFEFMVGGKLTNPLNYVSP